MKKGKNLLLLLFIVSLVFTQNLPVNGNYGLLNLSNEINTIVDSTVNVSKGGITLKAEPSSGKIWLSDANGEIWTSNPDDPESDTIAKGFFKMNMYSQLIVSYIGNTGVIDTTNNYVGAIRSGGIQCKKLEDGVRFIFNFENEGFVIPIEYRLIDNNLVCNIPLKDIEENGDAHIIEIQPLPFFGALDANDDGYLMIPDGCGALIHTSTDNSKSSSLSKYTGYVYGRDPILSTTQICTHTEAVTLPMFGVKCGDMAFLGIVEQGDALTKIQATQNNKETSLATVSPILVFRNSDFTTLREMKSSEKRVLSFSEKPVTLSNYRISYHFLNANQACYEGMALVAREYMKLKGMKQTVNNAGLYLELTAGIRVPDLFLGIPIESYIPLTSFSQAEQIITDMHNIGINGLRIKYDSWQKDGMYGKVPSNGKVDRKISSGINMNKLNSFAAENDATIFPTVDLVRIYKSGGGISKTSDAVRSIDGGIFKDNFFLRSTYHKDSKGLYWTLSKSSSFAKSMKNYSKAMNKYGINNFADLSSGNLLPSDGHHSKISGINPMDRQEALDSYCTEYDYMVKNAQNMLFDNGYGYTFPYATDLTAIPTSSSKYELFDEDIPFVQMVLHGCVLYSSPAINLSSCPDIQLLKSIEYGCIPLYSVAFQDTERLSESLLSDRYSVNYNYWKDKIMTVAKELQPLLLTINNCKMISHWKEQEGLYITGYDGGIYTAVNYGIEDVDVQGHKVVAGGYTFWKDKE